MKKIFYISFIILSLSLFLGEKLSAQSVSQIAYANSDMILEAMPDKEKASKEVNELNNKYKEELQLMQNDYNKKYSDFISYQTSMAENIRLRRMQELHELEQHINAFMEVAQEDVLNKEQELLKPLRIKVKEAIYQVGVEGGYVCVYDLANPAILFVTPDAVDITDLVKQRLGVK